MKGSCCVFALLATAVQAVVLDEFFPAFHVRPPRNWINDPNGPVRMPSGMVHLWMQYNPDAAVWGNMSWWHAASPDYVTWVPLDVSLTNDDVYDKGGVFSGSVTLVDGKPVLVYTCVNATGAQLQCIAAPSNASDPLLLRWVKSPANPVIPDLPAKVNGLNFRDPTTAWYDSQTSRYRMAVGSSIFAQSPLNSSDDAWAQATVLLYSTTDPTLAGGWTAESQLFSDQWNPSGNYECPDFFPIDGPAGAPGSQLWALKTSDGFGRHDCVRVGRYDATNGLFTPVNSSSQMVDTGNCYASKSFYDETIGERVIYGWVDEEDGGAVQRGWAGVQTLPRSVSPAPGGDSLLIAPLAALRGLRGPAVAARTDTPLPSGQPVVLLPPAGAANATLEAQQQARVAAAFSAVPDAVVPVGAQLQQEITAAFSFPWSPAWSATPVGADPPAVGLVIRQGESDQHSNVLVTRLPFGGEVLNNTDEAGGDLYDLPLDATLPEDSNVANCSRICDADRRCIGWTYVRAGNSDKGNQFFDFSPRCSLKWTLPSLAVGAVGQSPCCVHGRVSSNVLVFDRTGSGTSGSTSPIIARTGNPVVVGGRARAELHVFVDHSVVEAFVDGGRERFTSRLYVAGQNTAGVSLWANNTSGAAANVTVWQVNTIW
ncbi:Beta-fructofuranosidase [Diplonema papillatum]|nr:Beta-fructofuranosidase [Diplonema papillatum]